MRYIRVELVIMNKVKTRFITIVACFALLALLLGLAVGALMPSVEAGAVTVRPTSIFWAMTGGEVRSYAASTADAEAEEPFGYVTLVLAENGRKEGTVEYHKDLALKWYLPVNVKSDAEDAEGGSLQYFTMTFSFPEVNFETFTVSFSSAEENVTKEAKSVNEVIFKNTADGLYAYLKDASLQDDEHKDYAPESDTERCLIENPKGDITLAFSEEGCSAGEFALTLNGKTLGDAEHSKLTNVGGYFMEYRTSSNANVPMTFKAEMPANASKPQKVLMKDLNRQSLKVTKGNAYKENGAVKADEDGTVLYSDGTVEDNAAPALVLNQSVYAFTLGQRYDLDYEVMDVCDDSLSVSRYYYMAKKADGVWVKPNLTEQQNKEDGYQQLYTNNYFLPKNENTEGEEEYVSIRFTIDDGRDGATSDYYYYLTWYADPDADVVRTLDGFDYILIDLEKEAPHYTVITPTETADEETGTVTKANVKADNYDEVVNNYQQQLDEAAEKVSAGDGAYFYLPSLRDLITSDYADYRNLRFSIYYYKPGVAEGSSASSETSLRYNNLRFEIEEPGTYKFRVMAADAAGNTMQMYLDEGDNNLRLTTLSSSNIWDIEEIPDFTIEVNYTGAVIEDMEAQSIGYRGTSYSISSFDIVAYGSSTREYTLYYFDETKLKEGVSKLTYDELVEDAEKYLTDDNYKDCFTEIRKFNSDVSKEDEDAWSRTDNDYNWNPGTTPGSFTPQKSGYYVVKLLLIDSYLANTETAAYQAIDIRNPVDVTPGQIDWLRNNVTSVVLFAVSAVLAVAIVVLFVVKPPEKNVEEVDLDKLKGKKKNDKK